MMKIGRPSRRKRRSGRTVSASMPTRVSIFDVAVAVMRLRLARVAGSGGQVSNLVIGIEADLAVKLVVARYAALRSMQQCRWPLCRCC